MLFISQLGMESLSVTTIKSYLASIPNLLINNSFQDVNIYSPQAELVLRGIKHLKGTLANCMLLAAACPGVDLKWLWQQDHFTTFRGCIFQIGPEVIHAFTLRSNCWLYGIGFLDRFLADL